MIAWKQEKSFENQPWIQLFQIKFYSNDQHNQILDCRTQLLKPVQNIYLIFCLQKQPHLLNCFLEKLKIPGFFI